MTLNPLDSIPVGCARVAWAEEDVMNVCGYKVAVMGNLTVRSREVTISSNTGAIPIPCEMSTPGQ